MMRHVRLLDYHGSRDYGPNLLLMLYRAKAAAGEAGGITQHYWKFIM